MAKNIIDRIFKRFGYQRIPKTPPTYKVEAVSITVLRAQHRIHKSRLIDHVDAPEFAYQLRKHTLDQLKNEIIDAVASNIKYECTESSDGREIILEARLYVNALKGNESNSILNNNLKLWIA